MGFPSPTSPALAGAADTPRVPGKAGQKEWKGRKVGRKKKQKTKTKNTPFSIPQAHAWLLLDLVPPTESRSASDTSQMTNTLGGGKLNLPQKEVKEGGEKRPCQRIMNSLGLFSFLSSRPPLMGKWIQEGKWGLISTLRSRAVLFILLLLKKK